MNVSNRHLHVPGHVANGGAVSVRNGTCLPTTIAPTNPSGSQNPASRRYDYDYTVLSGTCIGWGQGWGWGDTTCPTQTICHEPATLTSSIYCHSADDYGVGGYDECDWSAFGDFSF